MQKISLNSEISTGYNISVQSYMLSLCVYTKKEHPVPTLTCSSNYASTYVLTTVRNLEQTILLRYKYSV